MTGHHRVPIAHRGKIKTAVPLLQKVQISQQLRALSPIQSQIETL